MSVRRGPVQPLVILLVEDDPAHAELVARSLEDSTVPNRVIHVEDGAEALDYLFRRGRFADPAASVRPHLILLDLRLPKVDGIEVLDAVRAAPDLAAIPIVMLTTSAAEQDVVGAYARHVNSYLVKPVDFDRFERLMHDLGFYWLTCNTSPVGRAVP
jgi:CheY-like chemotaxis protein